MTLISQNCSFISMKTLNCPMEFKTAERMAAEMRSVGLEVTENVGGTGVVGMLRNGEGPLLLLQS